MTTRHVHSCPKCYEHPVCTEDCTIEPDLLGTTPDGLPYGYSAECEACSRPDHYKVLCISFYTDDLARLDATVAELKRLGHRRVNRSSVLREALRQLELDCVPRSL